MDENNLKTPLFRQEVVEHIASSQYGSILLSRPFNHTILAFLFFGFAAAFILFFTLCETTRKAYAQGVLLPNTGLIRIMPVQAGVIVGTYVKEGQKVLAGQVLFVLSGERSSANAGSTQQTISGLMKRRRDSFDYEIKQSRIQARMRMDSLRRRLDGLKDDIARVTDQIKLQQNRIVLAEQSLKRYADLEVKKYISTAQLQEKQGELLDQQQRLADLLRVQSSAQRDLLSTSSDLDDLTVQNQRESESLQRSIAAVDQDLTENEARREILIRAPKSGTIGAVTVNAGQSVTAGTVLASLSPVGAEFEAEVYAPSRAIGFIRPGMQVLLRYQAFPYQKFGQYSAHVTEISYSGLYPQEISIPVAGLPAGEFLYRIRLKLDRQTVLAYGKPVQLKAGMLLDANIVLDHRKLYEWVLEPLYSISGTL